MFPGRKNAAQKRKVVCFCGDRVDLACISRAAGRARIDQLESFAVGGDRRAALARLRNDIGKSACTTLLGQGEYQLIQTDGIEAEGEERRNAMRWKIKDMVDFPVDNATLDVIDIRFEGAAASRGRQCFVAVSNNAVLAPRILDFQDARIDLDVIDIPELAQRNVAALFEQENRGLALLNFGCDGGLLSFSFRGELYVVRRIEISLEQLEQADEMRRTELFDRIALEVQRSVDNFERMYNFITLSRLISPDLPTVPGMLDYLRGYLSLPVAAMDLAEVMDFPDLPELHNPRRQAECLLTIGAALRTED